MGRCVRYTGVFFTPTYTPAIHSPQVVHICVYAYMCVYAHAYAYMDAYVHLWYCLTRWGVVTKIFYLCIRVHMHAYVHVCMYACIGACVYVCICTYVCLCISTHIHFIHARVGVHMHSCRRIVFICTFQSLYYMRVYHRCFLTLACMCVRDWKWGLFQLVHG